MFPTPYYLLANAGSAPVLPLAAEAAAALYRFARAVAAKAAAFLETPDMETGVPAATQMPF